MIAIDRRVAVVNNDVFVRNRHAAFKSCLAIGTNLYRSLAEIRELSEGYWRAEKQEEKA
jgi:hypothetical protein